MRLQGVYISSHLSPQFAFSQAKTAKKKKTNKQTKSESIYNLVRENFTRNSTRFSYLC